MKLDNPFDLAALEQSTRQIETLAAKVLGSPMFSHLSSWYSQAADLRQSYQFTKSIMIYIMYLIVAVGTINIAASMILLILENSAEIAIMKTFGRKPHPDWHHIYMGRGVGRLHCDIFGTGLGVLFSFFINEIIAAANALLESIGSIFASSSPKLFDKSLLS